MVPSTLEDTLVVSSISPTVISSHFQRAIALAHHPVDCGRLEHIDMRTSSTAVLSLTDCFCQLAGVVSPSGAEEEVLEIVSSLDVGT